jgi:hypothetical protein
MFKILSIRELRRYRLGSVGVQEVRGNKGGNVRTEDYTLSANKASHQTRAGFFTPHDNIRI